MKPTHRAMTWCALPLLAACAARPDHFYTLNVMPSGQRPALSTPALHVLLNVTIPSIVDRSEMIVTTSPSGILILDHQRWAAPLSDQVSQILARDLERRRSDLLIGDRRFDRGATPPATIKVDIVRMSAQRGGLAIMEAHWRIADEAAGMDEVGSDVFQAPVGEDYASVAAAFSQTLSALADTLAGRLQRR